MLKNRGEITIEVYTKLCNDVWESGTWPSAWTQSIIVPLPQKGNLKCCSNNSSISLISNPSEILLRIIVNQRRPQAEEIIAEEQAGFRKRRNTVAQIFNLTLLTEQFRNAQKPIFYKSIDYKKAFDRVWQGGMCAILKKFNISQRIVNAIEALYEVLQNAF